MMFSFTEPAAVQDTKTCGFSTDANLSAQVLELLSYNSTTLENFHDYWNQSSQLAQQATFKLHNILGSDVQKPQEIWVNFGLTV